MTYFESADGHSGLHIAVLRAPSAQQDPQAVLNDLTHAAIASLDEQPGPPWSHQSVPLGDGDLLVDSQNPAQRQRVMRRLVAQLPLVLNAAFHDYAFTSVAESNARLGPPLQSLWLTA